MLAYNQRAISAVVAPKARLRFNRRLFAKVVNELHRRGGEERESGAFLLGSLDGDGRRTIDDVIYYEDLDPNCTRRGDIELKPAAFVEAWAIAAKRRKRVVADIHSHPRRAQQSDIDEANPVVALQGHVALIVPDFGRRRNVQDGLGIFEYLGCHQWRVIDAAAQRRYLDLGWWL